MTRTQWTILWIGCAVSFTAIPEENWSELRSGNSPLKVVLPGGPFHGDEVRYSTGPGWFALVSDGNSSSLEPVALKIRYVFDAVLDGNEKGPYTGKSITTEPPQKAVVLLKGSGLGQGTIPTASINGDSRGLSAKSLTLNGRSYSLRLDSNCEKKRGTCQWILSDGKIKQIIHAFDIDQTPEGELDTDSTNTGIIWAGDLDGDGKLDLIVDVSNHYNAVAQIRVFLSSIAKKGRLVEKAGWFSSVGC
jgi:hypothetical protein